MRSLFAAAAIRLFPQRPSPTIAAFTIGDLLGLDARLLDVARPLVDFALYVVAELARPHRRRIDAEGGEARLELRSSHRGRGALVDAIQRRARRAGGRGEEVLQRLRGKIGPH